MRRRKELWSGIIIGFSLAAILFTSAFILWQIFFKNETKNITQVLEPTPVILSEPTNTMVEASLWEGIWNRLEDSQFENSEIKIIEQADGTIAFAISAHYGGALGALAGNAKILGNHAVFEDKETKYAIKFTLINDTLSVAVEGDFDGQLGNGVTIDGSYKLGKQEKQQTDFLKLGVFENEEQENAFKELVKQEYRLFADTYQFSFVEEDIDGLQAKVYSGAVWSLYGAKEGIVMVGPDNTFWAAVIDGIQVKYYTNSKMKDILPVTIDNWRKDFKELAVVSAETGEAIRRLTLEDVQEQGFVPMKEHSFSLKLEEYGNVEFVAGTLIEGGLKRAEYYLINSDGEVIYKIPSAEVGDYVRTRAVSFQNINTDNPEVIKDIIIIEEYTNNEEYTINEEYSNHEEFSNDEEYGEVPFPYSRIYSQDAWNFNNRVDLYEEMNKKRLNENILMIMEYIQDYNYRNNILQKENTTIYGNLTDQITSELWGEVKLIAAGVSNPEGRKLKLFLTDKADQIVYEFAVSHKDDLSKVVDISIEDIDKDGIADIIVLAELEKAGGAKAKTYPHAFLYIQKGNEFINPVAITDQANRLGNNKDMATVKDNLSKVEIKLNINDVSKQGLDIFKDRIYPIETSGWGKVRLIPGHKKGIGVNYLRLYLADASGTVLYQLPELERRDCYNIEEITFQDVDMDGRQDIIIISNYTTGFKTDGINPSPYGHIYFQSEQGFVNVPKLDKEINTSITADKANKVVEFLKNKNFSE